jgi:hypothetical protein
MLRLILDNSTTVSTDMMLMFAIFAKISAIYPTYNALTATEKHAPITLPFANASALTSR